MEGKSKSSERYKNVAHSHYQALTINRDNNYGEQTFTDYMEINCVKGISNMQYLMVVLI